MLSNPAPAWDATQGLSVLEEVPDLELDLPLLEELLGEMEGELSLTPLTPCSSAR